MSDKKGDTPDTNEQRSYFRINDVIPVVASHIHVDDEDNKEILKNISSSKAFTLLDIHGSPATEADETSTSTHYHKTQNKELYEMVSEIKSKLDYIINHFILEKEGLLSPERKLVNISASGIRFTVNHPVKVNDVMEVKLLLPTYPPVAVFAYGEIKRVEQLDDNKYEVSLEYVNMSENVRNEIIQYTLAHQRETIRKEKEDRK